MFRRYSAKLAVRMTLFVCAILIYLKDKTGLAITKNALSFSHGIKPFHIFWIVIMVEMVKKFFPQSLTSMGCRKQFESNYSPSEKRLSQVEMANMIKEEDSTAQKVLAVWFGVNLIVAVLFFAKILGESELVLLSLLYFVSDLVCVLLYCPFQSIIMKNRCCVTCRIFNWDALMICSPLVLIKSFYSWSLVLVAVVLLIWWEISYRKHPWCFFEDSNENLQCKYCHERICKVKKPVCVNHVHSRYI